jgi:hypothetical protein
MPNRKGYFRRIGNSCILTVGRSNQLVKTGDVILADFDAMMQVEGWKLEPRFDPKKFKMEAIKPQTREVRQPPAANPLTNKVLGIEGMQRREMVSAPRKSTSSERAIDAKYNEMLENNVIKLSTIDEIGREVDERANPKITEDVVINLDKLKEFKKYNNKDWFGISKDECVKILNEAHVDYSHVDKNEKWELVKFIKTVIKDI